MDAWFYGDVHYRVVWTGVLLAVPGATMYCITSLFLIAHFHNTIIGGAGFGYLAWVCFSGSLSDGFHLNVKLGKSGVLVLVSRFLL